MTTYHAIKRTQERAELNLNTSVRFIDNAINRGKTADKFDSIEREYLKQKESQYGCYAVAYNNFCFILSNENICITMYPLPAWFGRKQSYYNGKKKIREPRKHMLYYSKPWVNDEYKNYKVS